MVEIAVVQGGEHLGSIRAIFAEYLDWVNQRVGEEYGIAFDIDAILEQDLRDLGKFMPPSGRLLLGWVDSQLAGIACLKHLDNSCGEIKRTYVRPSFRKHGVGRALLARLLDEAQSIGYSRIRLDSARFMEDAHHLYRKMGFIEIVAYSGSEIPPEFQPNWVFMQKDFS